MESRRAGILQSVNPGTVVLEDCNSRSAAFAQQANNPGLRCSPLAAYAVLGILPPPMSGWSEVSIHPAAALVYPEGIVQRSPALADAGGLRRVVVPFKNGIL